MRIIKRGRPPEQDPKQVTCSRCKSLLEFLPDDLQSGSQYNESFYWVVCPVCNKHVTIDKYPWGF